MQEGVILSRRLFLGGLGATLAAPAIIRSSILMPVKSILMSDDFPLFVHADFAGIVLSVNDSINFSWLTKLEGIMVSEGEVMYKANKVTTLTGTDDMRREITNGVLKRCLI